jgi:O-antigen biosynthesis protein WbqP
MRPTLDAASRGSFRKRLFDVIAATAGLVVSSPVILAGVAAVRLTSTGPAIFRQTRVGLGEKTFTCLKLRTMYMETGDAPSHETPASAITPVGRWLRRFKIDELPQLWNVVRGEMSLVGPRPCLPMQKTLIEARRALGLYRLRPGITGIAQAAGIDMSDPLRLAQADAAYLRDMSLCADLRILMRTLRPTKRSSLSE